MALLMFLKRKNEGEFKSIRWFCILLLLVCYPHLISYYLDSIKADLAFISSGLVGLLLISLGAHQKILKPSIPTLKSIFRVCLAFICHFFWAVFASKFLPLPMNQLAVDEAVNDNFLRIVDLIYITFLGPVSEETVFRGLVMSELSKFKKYHLDVILSACLFSAGHVLIHGWSVSDFIRYLVPGLIFAVLFKKSKTIYPSMALHIMWNTFIWWLFYT